MKSKNSANYRHARAKLLRWKKKPSHLCLHFYFFSCFVLCVLNAVSSGFYREAFLFLFCCFFCCQWLDFFLFRSKMSTVLMPGNLLYTPYRLFRLHIFALSRCDRPCIDPLITKFSGNSDLIYLLFFSLLCLPGRLSNTVTWNAGRYCMSSFVRRWPVWMFTLCLWVARRVKFLFYFSFRFVFVSAR